MCAVQNMAVFFIIIIIITFTRKQKFSFSEPAESIPQLPLVQFQEIPHFALPSRLYIGFHIKILQQIIFFPQLAICSVHVCLIWLIIPTISDEYRRHNP
jgi:hypothetical protein